VESSDLFLGQVLEFKITRYGEGGKNIVLSRRQLLEDRAARAAEETRKKIVADAVLPGTVASLADFGAFIDLGGVQGLVPLSEISHSRVGKLTDRLRVGETVTVKVLKVDDQKGKITLSLKALEGDPWAAVSAQLRERQIVRGPTVRVMDFGVFVELLPGVDGLLHLSEIPRNQQGAIKEIATAGGDLNVLILSIDPQKRRIGLALAPEGAAPGEQVESKLAVGSVLTGTVDRVEQFGVFVRLGPGQVGLIPNAEMATSRGADHHKDFPPGTEIKVLVLAIEDNGKRIRLSRSKALAQEEQAETQAYMRGAAQKGGGFGLTLGDLLKQKRKV
jgi:small subunit ribosomal protein S1